MNTISKDIIILTPNGRRQKVHCSPDTTLLQVLEDACAKHGLEATQYDLKHHNHILDPTTTVRFSNLPNKATLEMVESEKLRQETNVTIGLMLEDGERRTADFSPNTSLFELISSLAPKELRTLQNPTIMFMRQEVIGLPALRQKTLRQLGLIGGRAILRLINKAEEARQANVSAVYRVPIPDKTAEHNKSEHVEHDKQPNKNETSQPGPSSSKEQDDFKMTVDALTLVKDVKKSQIEVKNITIETASCESKPTDQSMETDSLPITLPSTGTSSLVTQEHFERRLRIEEEVTFLGAQKAIAFKQPDEKEDELSDLPDDFYDLTIEEVRKLYKDLQQQRIDFENTPLLTSEKRQLIDTQTSEQRMAGYKNAVVRVQFPDHIVLQGIFVPSNTIEDVNNFIKAHLHTPNRQFHIYTTPLKETLNPKMTLLEAKFVPCVHMHFKWVDDGASLTPNKYLKEDIYARQTSSEAASILASKYRAPSRRKIDDLSDPQTSSAASSSKNKSSKLPKWFKK